MSELPTVLVVDDKKNMLSLMAKILRPIANVCTAGCGEDAVTVLTERNVDVVLCDLRMPDMDGLDVLRKCKALRPRAEFVLMTGYASVGTAVEALRAGAYDYLTKPFEPEAAKAHAARVRCGLRLMGSPGPGSLTTRRPSAEQR